MTLLPDSGTGSTELGFDGEVAGGTGFSGVTESPDFQMAKFHALPANTDALRCATVT